MYIFTAYVPCSPYNNYYCLTIVILYLLLLFIFIFFIRIINPIETFFSFLSGNNRVVVYHNIYAVLQTPRTAKHIVHSTPRTTILYYNIIYRYTIAVSIWPRLRAERRIDIMLNAHNI